MSKIRSIIETDWEQFNILELDTFPDEPIDQESFKKHLEGDGFFGLVNDNNILVGYIYCAIYDKYAHLHRIGVLSSERGKKFGSLLFEKAIEFFKEKGFTNFSLYVKTNNKPAINLYQKYGMSINFESWHFMILKDLFNSSKEKIYDNVKLQDFDEDSLVDVERIFPKANIKEIRGYFDQSRSSNTNQFISMIINNELKAIARFNKNYSGCRPFLLADKKYFDTFIENIMKLTSEEKNYLRITFDDSEELAEICNTRNYKIMLHMYKMEKKK